jgi:uncharacterized RDD family membrane protein YckC
VSLPPPLPPSNPYAAPVARVEDFQEGQLVLADRAIRFVAKLVDGLVFGVIAIVAIVAAIALPALEGNDQAQTAVGIACIVVGVAGFVSIVVYNLILLNRSGQTIGKRMLNIRILRSDGSHCELLRIIFARWLPVTLLGAIPLLGYIVQLVDPLMIFRSDQRCLHDLIADTIVVKA